MQAIQPTNYSDSTELYKTAVLQVIVRPIYSLTNRAKVPGEMMEDAIIWTERLSGSVPIERLKQAFNLACNKQTSSFAPNYFDVKNAWNEIEASERQSRAFDIETEKQGNRIDYCPEKSRHINSDGDVEICSPVNWNDSAVLPCRACQPTAYETERANFIRKSGKVEQTFEKTIEKMSANVLEFKAQIVEPKLSIEEIAALEIEHNNLIKNFTTDPEQVRRLSLYFDEAADCFRNPDFAQVTHSFDAVKKKIESYKKHLPPNR